jgi:uncharacterized protein (UPF0332 family)
MTPFDWIEYLRFAERLAGEGVNEATLRSCVSRAYYAGFHVARTYVRQHTAVPRKDTHVFVWRWLETHPSSHLRHVGNLGRRVLQWRREADYDPETPCTAERAELSIARVNRIIAVLSAPRV